MRTLFYKTENKANGSQIYQPLKGKGLRDGERTLLKSALLFTYCGRQKNLGKKKE